MIPKTITQSQFDQAKELGCFWVKVEPEPPKDIHEGFHPNNFYIIESKFSIGDELYVPEEWGQKITTGEIQRRSNIYDSHIMQRFSQWSMKSPSTMPFSLAKEVLTVTGIECELSETSREGVAFQKGGCEVTIFKEWHYKIFTNGGKDET